MKLPAIVDATALPAGFSQGPAPIALSGAATGLGDVGEAATRASDLLVRADRAQRQYQEALDATKAATTAADQLDQAEQTLKTGQRDPQTGEILQAPATSQDYMDRWLKARSDIEQGATTGLSPGAALGVQRLLARTLAERQHQARNYAHTLFGEEYGVGVDQQLADVARRAAAEPDNPVWDGLANGILAGAQGALTPQAIQAKDKAYRETVDMARVRTLAAADPQAAIEALDAGKYPGIPPDKSAALSTVIQTRWETRTRQEEAAFRRDHEALEKAWHAYQTVQVSNDYAAARAGALTLQELDRSRVDWQYTAAQYKEIRDVIEAPPKETPSDPATLQRVRAAVNVMHPTMSEGEITALAKAGLLNSANMKEALDTLVSRRREQEADAREVQNVGRSQTRYDQAEAERQLRAALGIPDILPPDFNPQVAAAFEQGIRELANRSNAFPERGGKENPLAAVTDIIPRARESARITGRVKKADLERLLPPGITTTTELQEAAPNLGRSEYERIADIFAQIADLNKIPGVVETAPAKFPASSFKPKPAKAP